MQTIEMCSITVLTEQQFFKSTNTKCRIQQIQQTKLQNRKVHTTKIHIFIYSYIYIFSEQQQFLKFQKIQQTKIQKYKQQKYTFATKQTIEECTITFLTEHQFLKPLQPYIRPQIQNTKQTEIQNTKVKTKKIHTYLMS